MATSTRTVSVGKVGFVWKGVYSATTAYTVWDTFLYNNSVYLCIADASAGTSPDNTSYFTCVSYGLVGKGEYNPANTYDINSIVTNGGTAYIAKEGGITGTWDSTKWMPIPTYIPQSSSVGITYVTTEADNDLVALWNLFNSSSLVVDGTQTTYGMTSVDNGSIIMSLTPTAPVFDCEATCQMNSSQPFSRLPIMDIPSLAMTDGDAITVSFLKWCGADATRSSFYPISTSNVLNTSLLEVGQHGFHFEALGSDVYLFVMHQNSATSLTFDMIVSAGTGNYFNTNSLNDLTFTIQRTATQYVASIFVNGNLVSSNTVNLGTDTTGTKVYLGNVGASAHPEYLDDRGLVQIAIYSGLKYTANYTPTYALLKKTV